MGKTKFVSLLLVLITSFCSGLKNNQVTEEDTNDQLDAFIWAKIVNELSLQDIIKFGQVSKDAGAIVFTVLGQKEIFLNCNKISPENFEIFFLRYNNIKRLTLASATDVHILKLAGLKDLTSLNLYTCYQLTDACIPNLPNGLIALNLSYCFKLTDACVSHLSRELTHLNLYGCNQLTDACIKDLPKELTYLDLSCCFKLTDNCIAELPKNLKFLNLSCMNIKKESVLKVFPSCKVISD